MGDVVGSRTHSIEAHLSVDQVRTWAYRCVDGLTDRRVEINDLNVFPIPDSDTGTNLVFTVRAAVESMRSAGPEADLATVTAALAHGAVAGARGNSGVIVSQVMRALAEHCSTGRLDCRGVQHVLRRASSLVVEVVSVPVEGTILTVLGAAADAAAQSSADLAGVVRGAVDAAAAALERTRSQLPVLDAAGVVDAGGLGLVIMLDALAAVVTGTAPTRARYHRGAAAARPARVPVSGSVQPDARKVLPIGYEVLYRVNDIEVGDVEKLRSALADLGDSVVVAGDGAGTWSAHVHTANAGLAVEVGSKFGTLHEIRIDAFDPSEHRDGAASSAQEGRAILAVVAGDGAEELYAREGATVLRCDTTRIGTAELVAAIVDTTETEVLVLPNGALSASELVSVSVASRGAGKDVLMLPSSSMVQGLAALAVHGSSRAAVDDAFTMSEAAAGTRWASLRIADEKSLTWVGTCEPGDGLGLVGREVVVIGPDVFSAGRALIDQLLSVGGEMVTMLSGEVSPPSEGSSTDHSSKHRCANNPREVASLLADYVADRHPGVEVIVYSGGQPGDVLQLGVE